MKAKCFGRESFIWIFAPLEAVFMLNRMKMAISDSEQPHSSNGLFFSLTCKQPLKHTALLIKCDFELWSITCIRLPIATSSVNSNMTKTALLVKSDFELWSVTCIEHELWSLTSFAHGQFNLFTTTFNWIYILSQWLVPFNRSLLVTFLNFNFTFFLLAFFDPFLFVNRLLIWYNCCSFGRTYVLPFGVGKFSIALTLGRITGLALICLLFTDVVSWRPNNKNESVCLGRTIFAVRSKQHKALENLKLIITGIISIFVISPICLTLFRYLWSSVLRCVWWFVCLGIFRHVVLELYSGKYIKYRFLRN